MDVNTQERGCVVEIAKSVNNVELILVEFDPKKDPKVYTKRTCHEKIVVIAVILSKISHSSAIE